MRQSFDSLIVMAPRPGLHEISDGIVRWVEAQSVANGLLTLFIRHTSASLLIHENAAPAARRDTEAYFRRIAPEGSGYEHHDEGPDDMPAHLRAALTATSLTIPVEHGS